MPEILEIHGVEGAPPYLVQWSDDGHVGLVFPGPDAVVQRLAHARVQSLRPLESTTGHDDSILSPVTRSASVTTSAGSRVVSMMCRRGPGHLNLRHNPPPPPPSLRKDQIPLEGVS